MILEKGEKIHLIVRRAFENDIRRHFIGEVIEHAGLLARVEGYTYVFNLGTNEYVKRSDKRIKIIGLADAGNLIHVLPNDAAIENAVYIMSAERRLVITDRKTFTLDINEFSAIQ